MRAHSLRIAVMGATIAIVAIVAPAVHAGAATTAPCTTTSGVTVIVDFAAFHHGIARGCAEGRPATALAAMQTAGFETAGTTQYGDAFVCRIDDLPAPNVEACAETPPAKSSWSFYWGRPTDTAWTYAPVGVLSYRPPPGTIIAFAFGDLAKPGVPPSAAIRVTEPSAPTTTPVTAPPATVPANPTVAPAGVTTTMAVAPPTTAVPPTVAPTTKASTTNGPATTSTSTTIAARVVDVPPITHRTIRPNTSGSAGGVIFAGLIVVGIGGASVAAVRARRRRAPS